MEVLVVWWRGEGISGGAPSLGQGRGQNKQAREAVKCEGEG